MSKLLLRRAGVCLCLMLSMAFQPLLGFQTALPRNTRPSHTSAEDSRVDLGRLRLRLRPRPRRRRDEYQVRLAAKTTQTRSSQEVRELEEAKMALMEEMRAFEEKKAALEKRQLQLSGAYRKQKDRVLLLKAKDCINGLIGGFLFGSALGLGAYLVIPDLDLIVPEEYPPLLLGTIFSGAGFVSGFTNSEPSKCLRTILGGPVETVFTLMFGSVTSTIESTIELPAKAVDATAKKIGDTVDATAKTIENTVDVTSRQVGATIEGVKNIPTTVSSTTKEVGEKIETIQNDTKRKLEETVASTKMVGERLIEMPTKAVKSAEESEQIISLVSIPMGISFGYWLSKSIGPMMETLQSTGVSP